MYRVDPNGQLVRTDNGQPPTPLSDEMADVLDDVKKNDHKQNVFLTGEAGTGKSWLVAEMIHRLRAPGRIVVFTATTGLACCLENEIVGSTVHEWAGIQIGENSPQATINHLMRRRKPVVHRIRAAQTLIIDEIGNLTGDLLDNLERVIRGLRGSLPPLQYIVVGDFLQLSPVKHSNAISNACQQFRFEKQHLREWFLNFGVVGFPSVLVDMILEYHTMNVSDARMTELYLFKSPAWKRLNFRIHALKAPQRQRGDPEYLEILARARRGRMTKSDHEFFLSRDLSRMRTPANTWVANPEFSLQNTYRDTNGFVIPFLHARRIKVMDYNWQQLENALRDEPNYRFTRTVKVNAGGANGAGDRGQILHMRDDTDPPTAFLREAKHAARRAIAQMQEPDVLDLRVGAPVICLRNLPQQHLLNGTRGTVVEIQPDKHRVLINFVGVGQEWMAPLSQTVCLCGYQADAEINHVCFKFLTIVQFPLNLGYALTIHKSQGQTFDTAIVCFDETHRNPGQAYVAISRVRSGDNLHVLHYNASSFVTDPNILEFCDAL